MGYNPRGYVPGGATARVAAAIQAKARARRRVLPRAWGPSPSGFLPQSPARPKPAPILRPQAPTSAPSVPGVDPLMQRANSTVFGMVNPLIQRLAQSKAQAEANARAAYAASTGQLEQGLMGTAAPITQAYNTAIGSSAAVNEAVADRLKGAGQSAGSDLAAKLAQIQADPSTANTLASQYAGAEGAGFASGAADLQHLLGQRAEAQAYTGKLPQIARIEGGRNLQQALSEGNAQFGERETALLEGAQEQAFNLWNKFREEGREDKSQKAAIAQANAERRSKERLALLALRDAATTRAEKRAYEVKLKNWERGNEIADAREERDFELEKSRLEWENSAKDDAAKRAFDARQAEIERRFKAQENAKNRKAGGGKGGSKNDTWQTPGSAKQARAIASVRNKIVNPETGRIRDRFGNSQTIDKDISRRIWSEIRLIVGNTTSKEAKALYRSIFKSLEGLPVAGGTYELPQFVK
jgi:hypothetical protein